MGLHKGIPFVAVQGRFISGRRPFFPVEWGLGLGTNNKAELSALYMLLTFTNDKGLQSLQVFGDYMLVINWIHNTHRCHNLQLLPIMEEVAQLKSIFNLITFRHIYREQNAVADHCSKEVAGPLQHAWDIEEHGPNGAF